MKRVAFVVLVVLVELVAGIDQQACAVPPTPDLSGPGASGGGRGLVSVGDDDMPGLTQVLPPESLPRNPGPSASTALEPTRPDGSELRFVRIIRDFISRLLASATKTSDDRRAP